MRPSRFIGLDVQTAWRLVPLYAGGGGCRDPRLELAAVRQPPLDGPEKVHPQFLSLRHLDPRRMFSARVCAAIKPNRGRFSHLSSGLLLGRARSLFSERPIYLRSSGLRGFGAGRVIPTFRRAYELQQKIGSATPLGQARASESNSPYRGSNPPAPARHSALQRFSFFG